MVPYIFRRLVTSVFILLGASFIVYLLIAFSGDPLQEFRESNKPNKEALMAARSQLLHLDTPAPVRYFVWLGGAIKCVAPFAGKCDLGSSIQGVPVTQALGTAIPSTLQLLTAATVLAIMLGVTIGIVTALRQYSALDYAVTFITFLFFSLPVFWVAVLLKEFGAIGFNNFLANPQIGWPTILVVAVVVGLVWAVVVGGSRRRRVQVFVVAAVATAAALFYVSVTHWFLTPGLGPVVIGIIGVAVAYATTLLFTGTRNRSALYGAIGTALLGVVLYFVLQPLLDVSSVGTIIILAIVALVVGGLIGWFTGGYDRSQSMRASMLTALVVGLFIVIDRYMQSWPAYMADGHIRNRPIATIGARTPNLQGDMWITGIDTFTHLVLPTCALILISLATYTRYSRASMLEVMGQDYVRTARAKGLPDRVVIMRHAFRNALIPLATIVAFDIGSLIGGAVITENVFSVPGMGALFLNGLRNIDPNPVMGVFVVSGITAVVFNLVADLAYSALDPRVRVKA